MRRPQDGQRPVSLAELPRRVEDHVGHSLPGLYQICGNGFDCFEEDPTPNRIKIALERLLEAATPKSGLRLPECDCASDVGVTRAVYDITRLLAEPIGDRATDATVLYVMTCLHHLLVDPSAGLRAFAYYWHAVELRVIITDLVAHPFTEATVTAARDRYQALMDYVGPREERTLDFFPSTVRQTEVVFHVTGVEPDAAWTRRKNAMLGALDRMHKTDQRVFREDGEFEELLREADREIALEDARHERIESAVKTLLVTLGMREDARVRFVHAFETSELDPDATYTVIVGSPLDNALAISVAPGVNAPSVTTTLFSPAAAL